MLLSSLGRVKFAFYVATVTYSKEFPHKMSLYSLQSRYIGGNGGGLVAPVDFLTNITTDEAGYICGARGEEIAIP